jgi:hypothetical protein
MKLTTPSAAVHRLRTDRTPIPLQWTEAPAIIVAVQQEQSIDNLKWWLTGEDGGDLRAAYDSPFQPAPGRDGEIEASIASVSRFYRIWRLPQERTVLQMGTATGK